MPNTIKPDDVKIGDRVRITVEGEVVDERCGRNDLCIKLTGGSVSTRFDPAELAHATIERIPEVIEAGDTVSVENWTGEWIVLSVIGKRAWAKRNDGYDYIFNLPSLTLIRKAVQS